MRSSLDYAGFAQLCARSLIMHKIMRAHNRIIQRSLDKTILQVWKFAACDKTKVFACLINADKCNEKIDEIKRRKVKGK